MISFAIKGFTLAVALNDVYAAAGCLVFAIFLSIIRVLATRKRRRQLRKENPAVTLHVARNGKRIYP